MPKVVLIGAGSVEFTRNVLADILTFPELEGTVTVALHDIDPERLQTAEAVARYTNEKTGAGAGIDAHLDRRAALDGADYAINEIQVGGYDATLKDFNIPKKHGLRQTIADTLGIGGIFRGLRTIPVAVGIGNDMAELCPQALLLNYTNPMAMVPWGVYEGTPFKNVVGVCHSVRDTHRHLAGLVGYPVEEIAFVTAGFNHQAFVLKFERNGQDLYPLLDEVIERNPDMRRRVRVEMYRRLGYFPTESSEHSSEYVPWFIKHDGEIERFRIFIDDYIHRSDENLAELERMKEALESGKGFEIEPTSELASEIIHAIETGKPRVLYGNVRNGGLIEDLPPECCVEVPCVVDRAGVHPTRIGKLPPQLAALNRTFVNVAELTVRAALEGNRKHVYHAAMLDPNTAATLTLDQIHEMCDELIEAHGDLMPEGIRRR
ncbi:MAG: alpha-glucosidase/alpha-galactosidase [Actinobacteria bacterium]|nr:alpha-glucosidase/alpha-galactosidase [Actinomycetota bacterium]